MRTMATPLPMFAQQAQQPLVGIEAPHDNDVLCGRGVTTNRHVGNENFRSLVNCNKELYVTSTKRQKMTISRSIVDAVRTLDPPGRFLEKDTSTGRWYDIGDKKAVEKTSQALRDGAACLRKQLSEDLSDPDFLSAVFDMDEELLKETEAKEASKPKPKEKKAAKRPTKGHRRTKSNPLDSTTAKAKAAAAASKKQRPVELPVSPRATQKSRHSLHLSQIPRPPQSPMSMPSSPACSRASSLTLPPDRALSFAPNMTLSPPQDSPRFFRHGRFTFDGPAGGISTRAFDAPAALGSNDGIPPPPPPDPMSPGSQCERERPPPPRPFPSPSYSSGGAQPMSPPPPKSGGNRMQPMSQMSPPPSGPLPPGIHRLSPAGYQQQTLSPPSVHRASRQSPYSGGSRQSMTPHHYRHPADNMSGEYRHGEYNQSPCHPYSRYSNSGSSSGLTVPQLGGETPRYDPHGRLPISPVQIGSSPRHRSHLRHRPQGPAPRPRPEFMPPPSSASPRSRNPERVMSASPRASGGHHRRHNVPPIPPPQHHSEQQQNQQYRGGDPNFYPRHMYRDMPPRKEEKVEKETVSETTLFVTPERVIRSTSTTGDKYNSNSSPSGVVDGVEVVLSQEDDPKPKSKSPIIQRKSSSEESREHDENPASDIDDEDIVMSPLPFESSSFFEDDEEDQSSSLMDLPENIMTLPISPCGPNDVSS